MLMCNTHMKWAILYMYTPSAFLCDDCHSYTNLHKFMWHLVHVIYNFTCSFQIIKKIWIYKA